MKHIELLAVGRSFGEVRARPAELKLAEGGLPRFTTTRTTPTPATPFAGSTAGSVSAREPQRLREDRPSTVDQPARRPAPAARSARRPRSGRGWRGWFRWWSRKGKPFEAPVQTELSLDTVQVVRNDLSDADVEVVTPARAVVGRLQGWQKPGTNPEVAVSRWQHWLRAWGRMAG